MKGEKFMKEKCHRNKTLREARGKELNFEKSQVTFSTMYVQESSMHSLVQKKSQGFIIFHK